MENRTRPCLVISALSLLFLSACVSTSFRPARDLETRKLVPVSPADVRVLTTSPSRAFRPVGVIEQWISGYPSEETILRKAREKAAAVGADAIVVNAERDMLWGPPAVGNVGESDRTRKLIYVRFGAIRFLPDDASPPKP